jgi:hypothetical protein
MGKAAFQKKMLAIHDLILWVKNSRIGKETKSSFNFVSKCSAKR